jgi:non-ribosomal peptide synthase protein (TIGR01720 family)
MMGVARFLSHIRDLGISLWLDGDDLRYSAPKGVLSQDLRAELVARKAEILAFLRETQAAAPSPQPGESEPVESYCARRTPTEKALAGIWAEVLAVERVGIHDNFFELGGDSLLGMQIVARANEAGLQFIPGQILENQTIAQLASVEGTVAVWPEDGLVTGSVPLTAAQCWWLYDLEWLDRNYWNVARILESPPALEPALLRRALQSILVHHDALRTRFEHDESGWQQFIVGPGDAPPFTYIDLSEVPPAKRCMAVEGAAARLQRTLDLVRGPLVRIAQIELGGRAPGRLLIVVHHLVCDMTSMDIICQDLETACRQLVRGEQIKLPRKTTSFKRWAERCYAHSRSSELEQELDYWLDLPWAQAVGVLADHPPEEGRQPLASFRTVKVALETGETDALLDTVRRCGAGVLDALLMAMVQAVTRLTGGRWVKVSAADSGRIVVPGAGHMDLSRTVGWFSFGGLMLLERKDAGNPLDALTSIAEQRRSVPGGGSGYHMLRSLRYGEDADRVVRLEPYDGYVSVNYLGQHRARADGDSKLFRRARESTGASQDPRNKWPIEFGFYAYIAQGRLTVAWGYSRNLHRRATIERVANGFVESIRALIAYCRSAEESQS